MPAADYQFALVDIAGQLLLQVQQDGRVLGTIAEEGGSWNAAPTHGLPATTGGALLCERRHPQTPCRTWIVGMNSDAGSQSAGTIRSTLPLCKPPSSWKATRPCSWGTL
jgi:hypothetical protein